MRRFAALLVPFVLLLGALTAAPVALAGDPCFHSDLRPAVTTAATSEVTIGECTFGPTVAHVAPGTLVRWSNASDLGHEVVGANLKWGAHDKVLAGGDTMGWTFDQPGIYPYTCMLHPGMSGAIVVDSSEAAVAPAGNMTSGGAAPVSGASGASAAASGEAAASWAASPGLMAAVAGGFVLVVVAGVWFARRRPTATEG